MEKIDITFQKEIPSKFPIMLSYPEYKFKNNIDDFVLNKNNSDGRVGVLFGLEGTGKKTFLRKTAFATPDSVIIHILEDKIYCREVEEKIEQFVFNDFHHIFIENITNVIDFQLLTHDIRKEYAHNCSFVLTGDSPYAFYIASLTSLLYSMVCFPTYNIYETCDIDEYIESAIFQNIDIGMEARKDDGIDSDFKYVCSLYKENKLRQEVEKFFEMKKTSKTNKRYWKCL